MQDKSVISVSVVIPTHNRAKILARTLKSLYAVDFPKEGLASIEVVVIANACNDNTCQVVAELASGAPLQTVCVEEPRVGLNIARNRGVEEAKGQIIALLDDDVDVKRQWLCALVQAYREFNPDLMAGRITLWWEAVERPAWLLPEFAGTLSQLDLGLDTKPITRFSDVVGANFTFKKAVYQSVGGFVLGLDRVGTQSLSCGEAEFVRRIFKAGFKSFYCGTMHVGHWVAPNRPTMAYVAKIMNGFGTSMILMREKFDLMEILAQLGFRGWCTFWYGMLAIFPRRDSATYAKFKLRSTYNAGAFKGVLLRVSGRSPLRHS